MLTLTLAVCCMLFTCDWNHVKQIVTCCTMCFEWVPCLILGVDLQQEALQFAKQKKNHWHIFFAHTSWHDEGVMKKEKIGWVKWHFKWWHFPWGVAWNLYSLLAHSPKQTTEVYHKPFLDKMESEGKGVCCFSMISSYFPSLTAKLWFNLQYWSWAKWPWV